MAKKIEGVKTPRVDASTPQLPADVQNRAGQEAPADDAPAVSWAGKRTRCPFCGRGLAGEFAGFKLVKEQTDRGAGGEDLVVRVLECVSCGELYTAHEYLPRGGVAYEDVHVSYGQPPARIELDMTRCPACARTLFQDRSTRVVEVLARGDKKTHAAGFTYRDHACRCRACGHEFEARERIDETAKLLQAAAPGKLCPPPAATPQPASVHLSRKNLL